jgi:transketolase
MIDLQKLHQGAKKLRRETIELIYNRKMGHAGGSFSVADILLMLFKEVLTDKDRFILSKGHASIPYFILLREKGFDPKIMGHPEMDRVNGIHCTTGSLGHGLPTGIGMAMAKKIKGESGKIYVVLSDAECQEGTTWESLLIAAQHNLNNVVVIVDNNHKQTLGPTETILSLGDLAQKGRAFEWDVDEVDGHSFSELHHVFTRQRRLMKPHFIVAHTTKGKGVKFMEQDYSGWHNAIPSEEQLKQALEELS